MARLHPLLGANFVTIAKALRRYGCAATNAHRTLALILASALMRLPFSLMESALFPTDRLDVTTMPPPLVIVGHWRSGTTHLHNLLSASQQFGFARTVDAVVPWDMFLFARLFSSFVRGLVPPSRKFDSVPLTPDSAQEDEFGIASMTTASWLFGIYFPSIFKERPIFPGLLPDTMSESDLTDRKKGSINFNKKVLLKYNLPLLIKNPSYTGQLDLVKSIFPTAKILHIHRHPYDVCVSTRNFYLTLLQWWSLQPYDHLIIDDVVISTYKAMMDRFITDANNLKAPDYHQVRYDYLDRDPLGCVEEIYRTLQLDGFHNAAPRIRAYLDDLGEAPRNAFPLDRPLAERVDRELSRFFPYWGYASSVELLERRAA
jgi:hypothetical protein